jgi:hypothetical protein
VLAAASASKQQRGQAAHYGRRMGPLADARRSVDN